MTSLRDCKRDDRPQRFGWAPGNYICRCVKCDAGFIGDKRAAHCADCAYAMPDTPHHDPAKEGVTDIIPFPNSATPEQRAQVTAFMTNLETHADLWADQVKLSQMVDHVASLWRLNRNVPQDIRDGFVERYKAQIEAIAKQAFIEGAHRMYEGAREHIARVREETIEVPRGLLDLCLGIIEEAQKHYPASANFSDDMALAISQLRRSLKAKGPGQ